MIETIYQVTTNYAVRDQSSGPLNTITRAATAAAAAFGVVVSAHALWDQLVAGPQQIPTSVVTMSSLINANLTYVDSAGKAVSAAQNFGMAQGQAKSMIDQMVTAAKTSAGSLQDFVGIGVDTINSFTQAGGQLGKPFVAFDKQVLTTASLLGEDFKQAGMDAMRILSGGAGMDVRLFAAIRPQIFAMSKDLANLPIDKATEKFNKMGAAARLGLFQKAMGKFATPEGHGAITGTLSAQLSTLQDNVVAVRNAFAGTFSNQALATLVRINAWFERNGAAIEATARRWGDRLAWAFDKGVSALQFLGAHAGMILPLVGAMTLGPALGFAKWLFMLKPVKSVLSGLISPLTGILTYAKGGVETFAMFRTMGAGLGRSLWGALTFGISPLTIGLVLLGLFAGYVASSTDRVEAMSQAFVPVQAAIDITYRALAITGGYIQAGLTPIMNAMGLMGQTAFGWVTQAVNYVAIAVLSLIAGIQKLGASAAGIAMKIVEAFRSVGNVMSEVAAVVGRFSAAEILANPGAVMSSIGSAVQTELVRYKAKSQAIDIAVGAEKASIDANMGSALDKAFGRTSARGKGGTGSPGRAAPVAQTNVTNIHGGIKIVQEFKDNAEPDRVAFAVKDILAKTARNPTSMKGGARMGMA